MCLASFFKGGGLYGTCQTVYYKKITIAKQ